VTRARPAIGLALISLVTIAGWSTAAAATSNRQPAGTHPTRAAEGALAQATGPLRVASVSPSVPPDGVWSARFDVVGPAPLDSTVSVSVRQAISGDEQTVRARLDSIRVGEDIPSPLLADIDKPILPLLTPGQLSIDVPIRSRAGDPDRVYMPNPGVHPVVVSLLDHGGALLQRFVLYLNRLPADPVRNPVQLALLLPIHTSSVVEADSTWVVPEDGRRELGRAEDLLQTHPNIPISVEPPPNLLDALGSSAIPADRALLARLTASLQASGGREILRAPWSALQVESWTTTGSLSDLQTPLVAGQLTVANRTGAQVQSRNWVADPTVGPGALGSLTSVGVDRLVVDPARLEPTKALGKESGTTRAFQVDGSGKSYRTLAIEPGITADLTADGTSAAEAAHDAITEMQAIWFATPDNITPAFALDLGSKIPTDRVDALLTTLDAGTPLVTPAPLSAALDHASSYVDRSGRRTRPLTRQMQKAAGTTNVAAQSSYLEQLRVRAAAYHSSMADTPGLVPLDSMLLGGQDRSLDEPHQRALLDTAAHRIDTDFAAIQAPARRSFTVTSRNATLPVQFSNGLARVVTVDVQFTGTRLDIVGGNRRVLELQPGINRLNLPVIARTSGQFTILVRVRTVDRQVLITSTEMRVRSTAFSGIGLLIGGGAIVFLALWWFRSWRSGRGESVRQDETASVS
jgi:hypothetical protein